MVHKRYFYTDNLAKVHLFTLQHRIQTFARSFKRLLEWAGGPDSLLILVFVVFPLHARPVNQIEQEQGQKCKSQHRQVRINIP